MLLSAFPSAECQLAAYMGPSAPQAHTHCPFRLNRGTMSASPNETNAPIIEVAWSSQRPELRDTNEDWSGVTDPVERRKLQNRLNQRARSKVPA